MNEEILWCIDCDSKPCRCSEYALKSGLKHDNAAHKVGSDCVFCTYMTEQRKQEMANVGE
jgi:hypothetical protein